MLARVVWTAKTPKFKSLPSLAVHDCRRSSPRAPCHCDLEAVTASGPSCLAFRGHVVPGSNASCVPGPISRKLDNKLHSCPLLRIFDLQISVLGDAAEQYFGEPARAASCGMWISSHGHGGAVPRPYWSTAVIDYLA